VIFVLLTLAADGGWQLSASAVSAQSAKLSVEQAERLFLEKVRPVQWGAGIRSGRENTKQTEMTEQTEKGLRASGCSVISVCSVFSPANSHSPIAQVEMLRWEVGTSELTQSDNEINVFIRQFSR
jgi:hypothetical protein